MRIHSRKTQKKRLSKEKSIRKKNSIKRKTIRGHKQKIQKIQKRRQRRQRRQNTRTMHKRGGVPNNNNIFDDALVRLPYTRQNIINGYAMSIARNPENYEFYMERLNIFLDSENHEHVTPEELNTAVQIAQQRLGNA